MDVVGGVLLADGTECKILTGIDDHSRFAVCAAAGDTHTRGFGSCLRLARGEGYRWHRSSPHRE